MILCASVFICSFFHNTFTGETSTLHSNIPQHKSDIILDPNGISVYAY